MKRRQLLRNIGLGMVSGPLLSLSDGDSPTSDDLASELSATRADDEKFWKKFARKQYKVSGEFVNLENGYFGVQPQVVLNAYQQNIRKVNEQSSRYMRTDFSREYREIVAGLAAFAGVAEEEVLITRNATEALNIAIQGLGLKAGDEVILHRQDYFSMIETFQMLEKQRGIKIRYIRIPMIPESDGEIVEAYRAAVTDRTRCILVTHLLHKTGQIMPVRKMADVFKPMGIELIVDAAHSFAQLDFKLGDLGADFVGVNLHKWFSNPLGAGMLYVKKSRIRDLDPLFGDHGRAEDDIGKLGHFGTLATPVVLTIPTAMAFNQMVTLPVKEARLRYLQNYWTSRAAEIDRVEITTPVDPARSCALASFRIAGLSADKTVQKLYDDHKIFTVIRKLEDDVVVRVTPNLYNTSKDMDLLLDGLRTLAKT